jgi:hypothetical protein
VGDVDPGTARYLKNGLALVELQLFVVDLDAHGYLSGD